MYKLKINTKKTKSPLNIWCITYIITKSTHFKRQLIESVHEDPLVMLGISRHEVIHKFCIGKEKQGSSEAYVQRQLPAGSVHEGAFFGAACMSHYRWSCKNFGHFLIVIYWVLGMIDFGLILCSIQFKVQNFSLGRTFVFVNHWSRLSENRGRKRNLNSWQ